MLRNDSEKSKVAPLVDRPFPWLCRYCGKQEVVKVSIEYLAEVRHDGRLHSFRIPDLETPVCKSCGERVFTDEVDRQVNDALRTHLGLMHPSQIRRAIERIGMSQKEIARQLGIAEESISRWINEVQIQSRSMDTLLRTYFAFPVVRAALANESTVASLGMTDVVPAVDQ